MLELRLCEKGYSRVLQNVAIDPFTSFFLICPKATFGKHDFRGHLELRL